MGHLLAANDTSPAVQRSQYTAVLSVCILIMLLFAVRADYSVPRADELRYIDYALNLAQHGRYGLSDYDLTEPAPPGAANAPLYPAFLGLMSWLDDDLFAALYCAGTSDKPKSCATPYGGIYLVQYSLAGVGLFFIWCWVQAAFGSSRFAWLVIIGVLLSGELQDISARLLTENFVLVEFFAFQLAFVKILQKRGAIWWIAASAALALLTLTRPEYLHLSAGLVAVITLLFAWQRNWSSMRMVSIAVLAFLLFLSPWSVRNKMQLDHWSITAGGYAEAILAYRLTFNRMSLSEWGASFVYWTPDVGDKIADLLLPPQSYERLVSANDNSFRNTAITEVLDPLLAQMPRSEVLGYMVRNQVIGDPIWFTATTAALFYRGIFIGKYWGVIGLIAYLIVLLRLVRNGHYTILWLSLPLWALVGFHALISPNVPRYNLALMSLYGFAWGWLLHGLLQCWWPGELPLPLRKTAL